MQATYHKKKLYVPNEIADKLELKDGDKVEYTIRGDDEIELKINRTKSGKNLLLRELSAPKHIGAKGPIKRREIYEGSY
jgi:bifunctional DNA-binding transcriptional regulator/antitoxin component of YhaV-PrlF toxin-antitoxin module